MRTAVMQALRNPILALELRGRMRTIRAPIMLTVFLLLVGGFGFLGYSSATSGSNSDPRYAAVAGAQLFGALSGSVLTIMTLLTPGMAATAISGERERQTLDLLLCTPLRAWQIVVGKLVSSLLFLLVLIAAALPLFSLVFFLAGVELHTVVAMIIIIASTTVMAGSVGVLASTLVRRTTAAGLTAYLVVVLLTILPLTTGGLIGPQVGALSAAAPGLNCAQIGPVGPCQSAAPPAAPLVALAGLSPLLAAEAELTAGNCAGFVPQPFPGPPAVTSGCGSDSISGGAFNGWRYWEVTLLMQSVLSLICVAVAIRALRGRRPRSRRQAVVAAPTP